MRKKERKGREEEKAERKRKQEVVSTKPKHIKTITETKTNHCVLCEAIWDENDPDDPEISIECDVCSTWSHASCAGYQTITSMKRHLFVVNLYLWATDIHSYSKHSTHPKELYIIIYIFVYS